MAVKWGARRQILYYIVGLILLAVLAASAWRVFFYQVPMCSDGVQNGSETGVDCGGSCAALCPDTAHAPTVLWARAFLTASSTYTAAAYIQNNNAAVGAGAKGVRYDFRLYDDQNFLVKEVDGTMDIPPVQSVPVVLPGIEVGERTVARTYFEFADQPIAWSKIPQASVASLRVSDAGIYQDGRLTSTIANDSYDDARKVVVTAILFDAAGVARAASVATIPKVDHRSSASVTFTWPVPPVDIITPLVTVLPSF